MFNTGTLFYGNTTTNGDGYYVPKQELRSPLFAASLWVGGLVDAEVRTASSRYNGFNFWPGPLDDHAALPNSADCSAFDRIYSVSLPEVQAYENGQSPSSDLRNWPVGLGAPAVDAAGQRITGVSRSRTLNLEAGERPLISGSQTAFWIMNDAGGPHTAQRTDPLGIEVRVTAFAIAGADDVLEGASEATFYHYEIINRNDHTIEAARVGIFADGDLGDATDDYIGTDTTRSMLLFYNADDYDGGPTGYGTPPALGIDVLSGAGTSAYFISGSGANSDPYQGPEYYHYLQGLWKDGTSVRELGTGYASPTNVPITPFAYPGDPVTGQAWSEVNNGTASPLNPLGDRRGTISSEAFDLSPGASYTFDVGILFAQGTDRFDSITKLRAVSDGIQTAYDQGLLFGRFAVTTQSTPEADPLALAVVPNPSHGDGTIRYVLDAPGPARLTVVDVLGRTVAVVASGAHAAGPHDAQLPSSLSPGLYAVILDAAGARTSRTITVAR